MGGVFKSPRLAGQFNTMMYPVLRESKVDDETCTEADAQKWMTYWLYLWLILAPSTLAVMVFALKPSYPAHQARSHRSVVQIRSTPTPPLLASPTPGGFQSGDWTTYMANNAHTGFNATETILTPATAPKLMLQWTHPPGGAVVSQPIVANGLIYWGSWDGY